MKRRNHLLSTEGTSAESNCSTVASCSSSLKRVKTEKDSNVRRDAKGMSLEYLRKLMSSVTKTTDKSLGDFSSFPVELIYSILEHLSVRELSHLSMVCKIFRDIVESYCVSTKYGYRKLFPPAMLTGGGVSIMKPKNCSEEVNRYDKFRQLGLLLKRTTCLYPTAERMRTFADFLSKLYGKIPSADDVPSMGKAVRFTLKCIGILLHTMIAGWDESECEFVFSFLEKHFRMDTMVQMCLQSSVGVRRNEEYYIRNYYRLVCLDLSTSLNDKAFWLAMILKRHSESHEHQARMRAKLLMIIYGPLLGHEAGETPTIAWWDLTDSFFIEDGLKEIGFAVHLLQGHLEKPRNWIEDNIVAIFEALIEMPDRWLFENTATLLFYSGDDIVKVVLLNRLKMGHLSDVANLIVYLALIAYKFKQNSSWILELIDSCCTGDSSLEVRLNLVSEIPIAFNEALSDIEHLVDVDDERDVTELHDMINALISLMKSLFMRVYNVADPPNTAGTARSSERSCGLKAKHPEE